MVALLFMFSSYCDFLSDSIFLEKERRGFVPRSCEGMECGSVLSGSVCEKCDIECARRVGGEGEVWASEVRLCRGRSPRELVRLGC